MLLSMLRTSSEGLLLNLEEIINFCRYAEKYISIGEFLKSQPHQPSCSHIFRSCSDATVQWQSSYVFPSLHASFVGQHRSHQSPQLLNITKAGWVVICYYEWYGLSALQVKYLKTKTVVALTSETGDVLSFCATVPRCI